MDAGARGILSRPAAESQAGRGVTVYPGIWARAFERWVKAGRQRNAIIEFERREFALPADKLLATLWYVDEPMPDDICATLELPLASTYSVAACTLYDSTFCDRGTRSARSNGRLS
jgi:hypothetical protein